MRLFFGKGDILVTECGNSEERHILMEVGRGSGKVGAKNLQHPDRREGGIVQPEDLDSATCTLTFGNPVSLGVVLEKALAGMLAFRQAGRTIGEENADLGLSIREMCFELLGIADLPAEVEGAKRAGMLAAAEMIEPKTDCDCDECQHLRGKVAAIREAAG